MAENLIKPYQVSLEELLDLLENKNLLQKFSSVEELVTKLDSSTTDGLKDDPIDFKNRTEYYGENYIPPKPPKSFFFYMGKALQDTILIFLMVAAGVMLIVGAITEPDFGWIEGIAILVAVLVVSLVTAFNDHQKEGQFIKLQKKIKLGSTVVVTRSGITSEISSRNLMVGDIVFLKYGDQIAIDGAIISSNDLFVDESSLTGESDLIRKDKNKNNLIFSGTNVMQGSGKAVVLAVGLHSQAGKIIDMLGVTKKKKEKPKSKNKEEEQKLLVTTDTTEETNFDKSQSVLQKKLTKLALIIGKIGIAAGVIITAILIIRFCLTNYIGENKRSFVMSDLLQFLNFLLIGFSILIVAIPEGLPLAVTLSLAFSVYKMLKDNNLVRQLYSCETMGNATTICSDKTGTLTSNRMTVIQVYLQRNLYSKHLPTITDISEKSEMHQYITAQKNETPPTFDGNDKNFTNISDFSSIMSNDKYKYYHILCSNISINKSVESSVEEPKFPGALPTQIGNKTECALIGYLIYLKCTVNQFEKYYDDDKIIKIFPFSSEKKMMSTVVELEADQVSNSSSTSKERDFSHVRRIRVLTKGAPEFVFSRCTRIINNCNTMETSVFGSSVQAEIKGILEKMASGSLRTIALAYKDIDIIDNNIDLNNLDDSLLTSDMIALCVFGIEDPVRPEVPKAINECAKAGVVVRMVTGDNLLTAKAIAEKCGIYDAKKDHIVIDSRRFNNFVRDETGKFDQNRFDKLWPRLRVLARSSPKDKYVLVNGIINSKLNKNREVVAVTGDGTNDAPALKKADVGFAMGISGTDVAKEASDIIITDDNFASIVKALMWGRNVYDAISKFIQFQLTVNVVAILISSFSTILYGVNVLKAIQLLWVNLIMDSLASLALATDKPTPDLLDRAPYGRNKSLLSSKMIRFISFHSLYQLIVLILLIFFADDLFNIPNGFSLDLLHLRQYPHNQHLTIIFNVFVMMQIFNEINARRVHGERNVFRKIIFNRIFIGVILGTVFLQVIIVQFTGIVFSVSPLDVEQWLWCVFIGSTEMIFHQIVITIPPIKLSKKYRFGEKKDFEPTAATSDDIMGELDGYARNLWIRGLYRLRQQIRVVDAFKRMLDNNSNRTLTSAELRKYQEEALENDEYHQISSRGLKKGWTVDIHKDDDTII